MIMPARAETSPRELPIATSKKPEKHPTANLPEGSWERLLAGEVVEMPLVVLALHDAVFLISPMSREQFSALKEDIAANGVIEPLIVVLETEEAGVARLLVLDGRHRFQGVKELGGGTIAVKLAELGEVTPQEFAVSVNQRRRQLAGGPKALSAGRYKRDVLSTHAEARQRTGKRHGLDVVSGDGKADEQQGCSRDLAAAEFLISSRTVDHASNVLERGVGELEASVEECVLPVSKAAELAAALPDDKDNDTIRELLDGERDEVRKKLNDFLKKRGDWKKFNDGRTGPTVVIEGSHLDGMVGFYAELDRQAESVSRLESWLFQKKDTPAGRLIGTSKVFAAINLLKQRLNKSKPFDLCPGCAANNWQGCDLCQGTGFVSKAEFKQWQKVLKEAAKKEAAATEASNEEGSDEQ